VDFTWEREWRIRTPELAFGPHETAIIVPSQEWAVRVAEDHEWGQELQVRAYAQVMEDALAKQYREDFPWRVVALR
jgi:hypothetical protein